MGKGLWNAPVGLRAELNKGWELRSRYALNSWPIRLQREAFRSKPQFRKHKCKDKGGRHAFVGMPNSPKGTQEKGTAPYSTIPLLGNELLRKETLRSPERGKKRLKKGSRKESPTKPFIIPIGKKRNAPVGLRAELNKGWELRSRYALNSWPMFNKASVKET
jgi:hypothetical protein